MDRTFRRGFATPVQQSPVVFGLQLKPFTLGHLFLLESLESPVVTGRRDLEFSDYAVAVFACAHTPEESIRNFRRWWFPLFVRFWGWSAKPHWIASDVKTFWAYLQDGFTSPSLRPTQREGGRTCNAPSPWLKLFFAMHVLHLSRAEAMALPVVELNILYATWAEWSGAGEIRDQDHFDAFWEFAKREDAKRFNPDGTRRKESLN